MSKSETKTMVVNSMHRQINHKTMRVIIGCIALFLAPMVYLIAGAEQPLTSISISYWTDAQDIFVGALIAVGFFLSAYNGTGETKDWEFKLSKAAAVFAICVALFPTAGYNDTDLAAAWTIKFANSIGFQPFQIHYGSAVLLFMCLIAMMWFFSNRALKKRKYKRSYAYRVISVSMVLGILVLYVYGSITDMNNMILFIEIWGLTLFGIGWLIAGTYKEDTQQYN